jgi:indolepyruvate ferredoxin oxidoreductase beta subunit
MIDRWYEAALTAQGQDRSMAVAALGGIVKGYGETRHRTTSRLMQILDYLERSPDSDSCTIASFHMAAMNPDAAFDPSAVLRPSPEPA